MLSRVVVSQVKHNSWFLAGLALGLWLALAAVPLDDPAPPPACDALGLSSEAEVDEFEPQREERPLGAGGAGGAGGRSVQRPRYYTTELGMRAGLLAGVLSSEGALEGRGAALNATARLAPAPRFFVTAGAGAARAPRPNVVAFTDTREMLKPFHALKYLADNYLEEYDFFFLVSDATWVNARRLGELAARLSVSRDVYMGSVAQDDSQYCTLEGGILLSNSVLRAVHGELDWCVRNSYSPHHHENIGRCVLHAAHLPCASSLQGESYVSARAEGEPALRPALADAATVAPLHEPHHFYQLHAYVSRVQLERAQEERVALRVRMAEAARRHPRGARNASWPAGLRADPGLAPPAPASRFEHLRWTAFNATHAFMPDDRRQAAPLEGATKLALEMVVEEATAWAARRWGARAALAEGAWCWQPPTALRYRLLLRLDQEEAAGEGEAEGGGEVEGEGTGGARRALRLVEAARVLGAARLAPARYVTESARVALLLPLLLPGGAPDLQHYAAAMQRDENTHLTVVVVSGANATAEEAAAGLARARNATARLPAARVELLDAALPALPALPAAPSAGEQWQAAAGAALAAALPRLARDALVLLAPPDLEFNEEFLNRVRMNTIQGEQWFAPLPFARYAQFAHPRFADADGRRPAQGTGHFLPHAQPLAFYRSDYDAALEAWREAGGAPAAAGEVLAASALRALRAPEPAALLAPRAPPCGFPRAADPAAPADPAGAPPATPAPPAADPATAACLRRERARGFAGLALGARHALAKLLLETEADL